MRHRLMTLAAALMLAGTPIAVAAQADCGLAPEFGPLREAVGAEIVGDCSGNPTESPAGDLTQATTLGQLVLRKGDGVAMFSNGTTTWLNGPEGLQSRLNEERLSWEPLADASAASTAAAATLPASVSAPPAAAAPPNPTAAYGQRCSDTIASTPNRGGPTIDQQWGTCVNLGEQYGPQGVDCYAQATRETAKHIGKINTQLQTTMFDATLDLCKASIR